MNLNKSIKETDAKFAFEKGVNFLNNKDYDSAETEFLASLRLVPNRTSVIYNLVYIYYLSKNVNKLETLIDQCKGIKNTKEIKLATAYKEYLNKNYKESIKIAESLINYFFLQTEDDQILFLLALNYKCLGNYLKTLNIYRKILFRNRDDDAILENIGFFFFRTGKNKKSLSLFKKRSRYKS